jgi:catechol 2,3-dioxygenase-like lactoylglutathione lyase family enzyme
VVFLEGLSYLVEGRWELRMLASKDAMATIAVKDIEAARRFYEGTLGLKPTSTEGSEAIVFGSEASSVLVYRSHYAGTNKATAVTWVLGDDLETVVQGLKAKGVAFEHYDMPETTRRGDVHVTGQTKAAWLKDPDGNILALVSR